MENKIIKICCVLLSLIMMICTLSISAGNVYARFENKVSCRTILDLSKKTENNANFFTKTSEANVVVLAGKLDNEETITFKLESPEAETKGKFFWSAKNEHAQFVNIEMSIGNEILEQEEEISVLENEPKTVAMKVFIDGKYWEESRKAADADVFVTWGELGAVFRFSLPEVVVESEENEDVSGGVNVETPPGNENGGTSSAEGAGKTPVESNGTQDGTTDSGNTPEEPEQEPLENSFSCIASFDPEQYLPVKVTLADDVTGIVIGLAEETKETEETPEQEKTEAQEETGNTLKNFPVGTKFSLDKGKSFYMLYSEDTIKLKSSEISGSILFDFKGTELYDAEIVSLVMEPWADSVLQEIHKAESLTNAAEFFETKEKSSMELIDFSGTDEKEAAAAAVSETEAETDTENKTEPKGFETFVLNGENAAELVFPKEWADAKLTSSVQFLNVAENGSLVFNNTENIFKEYIKDETTQEHSLVIGAENKFLEAGTYRVYMIWEYEGIPFFKKGITFFVNYSTPTSSTLKSQEVPYGN